MAAVNPAGSSLPSPGIGLAVRTPAGAGPDRQAPDAVPPVPAPQAPAPPARSAAPAENAARTPAATAAGLPVR